MSVLTSDNILDSIKRTFSVPTHQQLLTDTEILSFCDEELLNTVCPELVALRGEYFTTFKNQSTTAGTQRYRIPERAMGRTLRDLKLITSGGDESNLTDIGIDDKHHFDSATRGQPTGFYTFGDYVYLVPTPDAAYTLQFIFDLRPSSLVATSAVATVAAVNQVTDTLTLSASLSGLTTNTPVDIVAAKAGNIALSIDLSPISVSGVSVQFATDELPDEVAVGDYLCFAKQSPVVPIPEECLPVLIQAAGNRVMLALGDLEALQSGEAKLKRLLDNLRVLLAPRVRGESRTAVNQHFLGNGIYRSTFRRG